MRNCNIQAATAKVPISYACCWFSYVAAHFFSVDDWLKNFENKVKPFVEMKDKLDEAAAKKMGIKDPEAYP